MHIDCLPPELHELIISYVCCSSVCAADLTCVPASKSSSAYALSLVSHYWSSISRPFLAHSLTIHVSVEDNAITDQCSVESLLTKLKQLPVHDRRVRELWISDAISDPSKTTQHAIQKVDDSEDTHANATCQAYITLMHLLALLAPHLRTISCSLKDRHATWLFGHIWSLSFPQLNTLQISGLYPIPSPPSLSATVPMNAPLTLSHFPVLEHLILSGVRRPPGLLTLPSFSVIFPHLTNLSILGVACAPAFAHEVAHVIAGNEGTKTISISSLPHTLECVRIGIGDPSVVPVGGLSSRQHSMMISILERVSKQQRPSCRENVPQIRLILSSVH